MRRPNTISIKNFDASNYPQLLGKLLILALALFIVACASTTVATSKPTPTSQQVSPTKGPLEQTAKPGSVEVKITLVEFRITSSVTVFHTGTQYYFVVSNRGHDIHEFMIMPGTTWTTNFTFTLSATDKFEFACQMGRHYQAGMRLPITVNK